MTQLLSGDCGGSARIKRLGKQLVTSESMLKKNRSAPNTAVIPVLSTLTCAKQSSGSQRPCHLPYVSAIPRIGVSSCTATEPSSLPNPADADAASSTLQGPGAHSVTLRVTAIDELFGRAKAAGARVLAEPADHMYGERQCSFLDPWGHPWTLSETIFDSDPADWGGELLVE